MIRAVALLALMLAAPGVASAQAIGPFTPDAPLEATVAAHPAFDWTVSTGTDGSASALAERPLSFAGLQWEVELARYPGSRYAFSLLAYEPSLDKEACFGRFAQVVAALEPIYGPFGRHPAFARENNALYGFAFTAPGEIDQPTFRLREAGKGSLAREDAAWPAFDTFAEVDLAGGEAVAVIATTSGSGVAGEHPDVFPGCTLKVEAFQSDERIQRGRALNAPTP